MVAPSRRHGTVGYRSCKYEGELRNFKRHQKSQHGGRPVVLLNAAFGVGGKWHTWLGSAAGESPIFTCIKNVSTYGSDSEYSDFRVAFSLLLLPGLTPRAYCLQVTTTPRSVSVSILSSLCPSISCIPLLSTRPVCMLLHLLKLNSICQSLDHLTNLFKSDWILIVLTPDHFCVWLIPANIICYLIDNFLNSMYAFTHHIKPSNLKNNIILETHWRSSHSPACFRRNWQLKNECKQIVVMWIVSFMMSWVFLDETLTKPNQT